MTAVAEQAGASIGTLYDYFPDKPALAQALAAQYAEEADAHWAELLGGSLPLETDALASLFVEGALVFVRQRPAYMSLFGAPSLAFRSPSARQHLRKAFAEALRHLNPNLTKDNAFLSALVVVELIKALLAVCRQVTPRKRDTAIANFTGLLASYLRGCLDVTHSK